MKRNSNTVIIVMALCMALACTKKNTSHDVDIHNSSRDLSAMAYASNGADSPFISVDSANKMIRSYLNSTASGDLHSLIVDAQALRFYLQDTSIKKIKLMFAHRLSYINNGGLNANAGYSYDAITVVVAGFNANNNYVYSPAGTVVDNAMPCPYNCPVNGTAQYDVLPE